jgi:hypothetical protein
MTMLILIAIVPWPAVGVGVCAGLFIIGLALWMLVRWGCRAGSYPFRVSPLPRRRCSHCGGDLIVLADGFMCVPCDRRWNRAGREFG